MIIVGAKGFAKQLFEVFCQMGKEENIAFFDNVTPDLPSMMYDKYPILKSEDEVRNYMDKVNSDYCLGIGNSFLRKTMKDIFDSWGGDLCSVISPHAYVSKYCKKVGRGACILTGAVIENDVTLEDGVLINLNATIAHDTYIDQFSEIAPGVNISGNCTIGSFTQIGTGAVLIPGINIGHHSIIAAGAVVTSNLGDKVLAAGVPAKIKKKLNE